MKNNKTDELIALLNKSKHLAFSDIEMKTIINNIEALLNKRKYLKNLPKKLISNGCCMLGYYFGKTHNYHKAIFWLNKLENDTQDWILFKDTLFPIMISNANEERTVVNDLTTQFNTYLNSGAIISYNSNILSHSFWYAYIDNNPKEIYEKYSLLQAKVFPSLYNNNYSISNYRSSSSKIKLGIISSALFPRQDLNIQTIHSSSISDSFYSTLLHLDSDKFELIFIHYSSNKKYSFEKNKDVFIPNLYGNPNLIREWQRKIANLNLDILLYLDLHIESGLNWLAQSKLAKIQILTHGHPVTSGINKEIMNYFISWEAAEIETAQEHYTEELVLIPKNIMWEKFIPRNSIHQISMVNGKSWKNINRNYFKSELKNINVESNWYFCSQATFKLNYNFDSMIKGIMEKDSNAEIIMIHVDSELYELKVLFIKRLKDNGIDLNRIHFIAKMPHHIMMAMYNVIDVSLDSFFFGGDTTTREAFEIGTPIVTLPHKYLGSRWTYAYYTYMGVLDLIAKDPIDYINIAVNVATNKSYAKDISNKIKKNSHKIFNSKDASKAWGNVLERLYNKLPIKENKMIESDQLLRVMLVDAPHTEFIVKKEHLQEIPSGDSVPDETDETTTIDEIEIEKDEKKTLKGGTELMRDHIQDILEVYADKFNVITNIFEQKDTIDTKKSNIYWCNDNEGDPLYQNIKREDIFVFVTEYQKKNFIEYYSLDSSRCHVIKNAIIPIEKHKKPNDICRLIYMSTPHRGLDILVTVFEKLVPILKRNNTNVHLDIYSSFERCGRKDLDDSEYFKSLYEKIINHQNMTYHGSVNHHKIIEALKKTHIFAYPSTFKETSCLCLIEAMSAGCVCVHSSLGALPDTSNGLTCMYEYTPDKLEHCTRFAKKLMEAIYSVKTVSTEEQIKYIEKEHNIVNIRKQWVNLLKHYSEI